jgi:hypothetical protein
MDTTRAKTLASTLGRLVGICAAAIFLILGYRYVSGTEWWAWLIDSTAKVCGVRRGVAVWLIAAFGAGAMAMLLLDMKGRVPGLFRPTRREE